MAYRLGAQPPVAQSAGQGPVTIDRGFSVYLSPDLHVRTDSIFHIYTSGGFRRNTGNVINTSYSQKAVWVGITLHNRDSVPLHLRYEVAEPSLDELELFKRSGGVMQSLGKTGDLLPFRFRPVGNRHFVYPVTLLPGDTMDLLLYINNGGHTTYAAVYIKDEASFTASSQTDYLFWGFFAGIWLFVSLFSLFIFISLREKLYLLYSLYLLAGVVWACSNSGIGYQYLWSDYPEIMARIRFVSGTASIALLLHFMQLFIGQRRDNSRLFRLTVTVRYALWLLVGLALLPLNLVRQPVMVTIFLVAGDIVSLAAVFCLLASPIEKIRQGVRTAIYYLFAASFFFTGICFTFLIRLGIIAANGFTINVLYAGALLEVVILTFGLTTRYHRYKNEREKLLIRMKEKEINEAVSIALAKEEERKRIAADMHDDLGAGLSGLQLMSELSSRKMAAEELKKDVARISSSARELGDKVRDIVWTLNPENDSLENLVLYIHKYGHQLFEEPGLSFRMNMPDQIPPVQVSGAVRRHIFLLVREAFNNILKHAKASEVVCSFSATDHFSLTISDNGTGFPKDHRPGNGIANMQRRIAALGGQIGIDTQSGTTIRFTLALQSLSAPNGEWQ
ncbi:MAG: 7TM diverse intracellular signaling domain-containing protein [Chitinophagaceae bacterium]